MGNSMKRWTSIAVGSVLVGVTSFALAQPPSVADSDTSSEEVLPSKEELVNRSMIWAPTDGGSMEQFETYLNSASVSELMSLSEASSQAQVEALITPSSLGEDTELVYTGVDPCRLLDTRNAGGALGDAETREFYVYGVADIANQGGNPAGCESPKGEPLAVHLNLTVVPVGGSGNARVYPADVATPNASAVNFKLGTNIANALITKTFNSAGNKDIEIFVSKGAHVIADVLGYFYAVDAASGFGTVRGNYAINFEPEGASEEGIDNISFGITFSAAPTPHLILVGNTPPAECPGTSAQPEAAPGHLCVYESYAFNRVTSSAETCIAKAGGTWICDQTDPWGATVWINSATDTGRTVSVGSWAATPP